MLRTQTQAGLRSERRSLLEKIKIRSKIVVCAIFLLAGEQGAGDTGCEFA